MSARYTQSKGEAAKHSQILRDMLKRPENKLCADCKRNDPRWASTNLGCFMCIRCSGIHRGIGVHITRIKSVDLDTWSPEQIENIQRWGNRRANAYWEAHLKPGHAPPEHKMESFIRSKYESRRWAMEGPVPEPESLDGPEDTHSPAPTPTATAPAPSSSRPTPTAAPARRQAPTSIDLLAGPPSSHSSTRSSAAPAVVSPPIATATSPPPVAPAASNGGGLFDLDFNAPPPAPAPRKDAKADILSLFASAPPPQAYAQQQQQYAQQQQQHQQQGLASGMGGLSLGGGQQQQQFAGQQQGWGVPPAQQQQQGHGRALSGGAGGGGAANGGFGAFEGFGAPPQQAKPATDLFGGSANVWGGASHSQGGAPASAPDPFGDFSSGSGGFGGAQGGKQDAFSDIWK